MDVSFGGWFNRYKEGVFGMINFSILESLTIPEGVVKSIRDASGKVIWQYIKPAILQVAKQTITTTAGETTYENNCVLLTIYPRTANSTVRVTYGDLTKVLTFTGTNGQIVFFGTFEDASDTISTPSSGILTIEGGFAGFGTGTYTDGLVKDDVTYCPCITEIIDMGGVTKIPGYAFAKCTSLTSVNIPDSVTSIEERAFYACTSLTSIEIPNSVTSTGYGAFRECTSLTSVEIPNSVTSISGYSFYKCTSLNSVNIPDSVTSIGHYAFENCTSLTSITFGKDSKLTTIYDYAFAYCQSLVLDVLPNKITTISAGAFNDCPYVWITRIPEGVTSIGEFAFNTNTLKGIKTELILPMSLLTIGNNAFTYTFKSSPITYACRCNTVTILATTPPTTDAELPFGTEKTFKIIVPKGCGNAYKAAEGWSEYADIIVEVE